MLKTVCPSCDTPLKGPDDYAGLSPRCPRCKARVAAPDAPAPEPQAKAPASEDKLLDALLAEAHTPPPSSGAGSAVRARPEAAPKPNRPAPVLRPKTRRRPGLAIAAGAALVVITLGAGAYAVSYIREHQALSAARVLADRIEPKITELAGLVRQAEDLLKAEAYAKAKDVLESAQSLANGMTNEIKDSLAGVSVESARKPLQDALGRITADLGRVKAHLLSPLIVNGAKGMVQYKGQWMTPEQKKERYDKDMLAEGRTYREEFKEYLTDDEYNQKLGRVKYKDQWMTPAQVKVLQAEEQRRAADSAAKAVSEAKALLEKRAKEEKARKQREEAAKAAINEKYPPDGARWTLDDFEEEGALLWKAEGWGNPCAISVINRKGSQRLQLAIEAGAKDKAAISRGVRIDLTSRDAIEFDIENATGDKIGMALAIQADEFYESRQVWINPGPNAGVKYRLQVGDFKSKSSDWRHETKIKDLNNVRTIFLLLYTKAPGAFYLDNVAAVK